MVRFVIIGEGKMALDCAKLILANPRAKLIAIIAPDPTGDRRLRAFCEQSHISIINGRTPNEPGVVDEMARLAPDFLLSINNYRILRKPLLATATRGAVNFHNGPLPRYGGVNIPTWVIWNAERQHGVTWHYIDEGIDTGDIAAQGLFELMGDETAATLTFHCINKGIELFPALLDDLLSGKLHRRTQTGERTYFSSQVTPNGGYIDPQWDGATLSRFVRAMSFHPFPSPFGPLKLRIDTVPLMFRDVWIEPGSDTSQDTAPGTLMRINEDELVIRTIRGELHLSGSANTEDTVPGLWDRLKVQVGDILLATPHH